MNGYFICTDLWRQYRNVIAARASHVVHVFDRFHVIKKLNEKIDKVCAEEAGRFMDQWCVRAMRSKIDPMQEMAGTLRRYREILLNWFRARGEISNGSVEGMNNKAKLAIKKCVRV